MAFNQKDIISIRDFDRKDIEYILKLAEEMEPIARSEKKSDALSGKLLGMLFYEPSTRTRLSFEAAMKRLGGSTIGFAEAGTSSATKGENLTDTVRIVGEYSDALVIRHNMEGTARFVANIVDVPVINAGDGAGQHPTQTMLDLYTMKRILGRIDDLRIALVGDLKYGRTVHSLAYALAKFDVDVSFVSPKELKMPREILHDLSKSGVDVYETDNIHEVLDKTDVLYVTRIQKERFPDPAEYLKIKGAYTITSKLLEGSDAIVMHPLPRIDEISHDVDNTPQGRYFEQAFYGVPVRMALLKSVIK
ncbi:aspartate carbamoyltransferase [Methanobacterium veterum]|jgi:aspartate carbamoyltransferase catalytic subunit|uniref:Aspartate carbamoyltransferase n=2 Tax=Methanobacteriaceae TaxID=2159 RepID=A0A9E4ZYR6_9EURY|nr:MULTISPECIES: aspartate carbamoyltransferase [Methanobacterium]MCZ3365664.1 aspartate carbamoyltransferase [Methanobacterium veterum]MCZ3371128.1 aspartate carbamoyltransferase [Methanobacterium veterum]